ncbi:MAG: CZB domain-containing protein [Bacteroidota bacterium]
MKISTKLTIGISALSAILILVAALLFWVSFRVSELILEVEKLPELQAKFGTLTIQHYAWAEALGVGTILMKKPFTKALDHTKCDLGKWYYSYSPPDFLKEPFEKLEEPHKLIHASGAKIVEAINRGDVETAIKIYQEETTPNLEKVRNYLTDMRLKTKEKVDQNLISINSSINNLKNIVIIVFSVLILLTIFVAYFFVIKPLKSSFSQLIAVADAVSRGDFSIIKDK